MATWKLKKKTKRKALGQYDRWEMIQVTGIPDEGDENCIEIIYKICKLTSTNLKKSKIEIAHRMKNGIL